jgi:N-acylneuraminate cytidylyltransferase
MDKICIIPARGGSKRIPRKNIKEFCGKPIITYSIKVAIDSKLFDEVMVSTDDKEISDIAIEFGANVPFLRSNKNSDDYSGLEDVVLEVLNFYQSQGIEFKSFCCLLPTAPFITINRIRECLYKLETGFSSVFPVLRYSYPIQRSLKNKEGKVEMAYPQFINSRSQDLEPRFHDSGQFYWMKVNDFYQKKELFSDNTGYIELSEMEVQDIDTPEDWEIAEFKFNYHAKKKNNNLF